MDIRILEMSTPKIEGSI
uniref:Uncharacterized protein n=1 Tax=Arundo donax TaxID=35708 RepID=A0A0A8YVW4_ARUDO